VEKPIGGAAAQTVQLFLNGSQQILEQRLHILVRRVGDLHRQMTDPIVEAASGHAKWGVRGRARPDDNASIGGSVRYGTYCRLPYFSCGEKIVRGRSSV